MATEAILATIGIAKDVATVGVSAARTIASAAGRRSITRLAKDAIFQFPHMVSGDIETDEVMVLAHSFEKEYASFVIAAIGLDKNVDRRRYRNTRDFLRTFHSSDNIPAAVFNNGNVLMAGESFDITAAYTTVAEESGVYCDPLLMASLFTAEESQFDMNRINDAYKPFTRTAKLLRDRIDVATEAKNGNGPSTYKKKALTGKPPVSTQTAEYKKNFSYFNRAGNGVYNTVVEEPINDMKNAVYGAIPEAQVVKDELKGYVQRHNPIVGKGSTKGPSQVNINVDKLAALEPTLVNVTLVNYTSETTWEDTITLGIKAMVRLIPSGQMVANMVDACEDRAIFKFIKWTKGELGLHDLLFGGLKKAGIENARGKWLSALKTRAAIDNVSRFIGARLLPSTTIIITETEALEIMQATGVDLHQVVNLRKLFKKYFLLGFGIYDTNTKILSAFFDGDEQYTQVSFRALAANMKKETDLLNASSRF